MERYYPLVWIVFFVCIFFVWFFSHKAKHKERMMMMEKGFDTEHKLRDRKFQSPLLKLGIVIIGLGTGLLIIALLVGFNLLEKWGNLMPLAILVVCGGISMVMANYVNGGKNKPD